MDQTLTYPQFRKYKNNKGFFRIISGSEWEEILVLGERHLLHHFEVKILPDRNFLYDMTFDYEASWEKITEEEYETIKKKISGSH